ncbi:hypothetical protein Lal_00006023 [Lupinus albus]|nr:hypothetical protein Lal_00006023 [Lupinus albus]
MSYLALPNSLSNDPEVSRGVRVYLVWLGWRSLTHLEDNANLPNPHIPILWRIRAPLKVTTFVWRLFQDRIQTKDALAMRGISSLLGDGLFCSFCNAHLESPHHLFSTCNLIYQLLGNY